MSLSPDNQRLIETVRDGLDAYWDAPSEYHWALDLIAARLARLETLEREGLKWRQVCGCDCEYCVQLDALLVPEQKP